MNKKERSEWLKAVGACLPESDVRAMASTASALDAAGAGRWEVSVQGGGLRLIGLRFFGTGHHARWLKACRKSFSLKGPGPNAPRDGFPWLTAAWDLKTGRWTVLRLCGGARGVSLKPGQALAWDFAAGVKAATRRLLNPVPFKEGIFKEPILDRAFDDFSRLSSLAALSIESPGWSLRFAQPLRWPLFARCDMAASFAPQASQLALFLLDRKVAEISFDGEALWAHCGG